MVTGFPPFNCYTSIDTLYKFLDPHNIKKIWVTLEKRIKKPLSLELKDLLKRVFLEPSSNLKTIEESKWINSVGILPDGIESYFIEKETQLAQKVIKKKTEISTQKKKSKT